jgi:hypothetical protein
MAALSRLGRQFEQLVGALGATGVRFALIGGLALGPHRVVRATQDIDLLIDAGNYLPDDERVDLLYANRPIARRLLQAAAELGTPFGVARVISAEGLIGFKLQGLVNNPRRTQDLEDIRALLRANHRILQLGEVREYFQLFGREDLLKELLDEIE